MNLQVTSGSQRTKTVAEAAAGNFVITQKISDGRGRTQHCGSSANRAEFLGGSIDQNKWAMDARLQRTIRQTNCGF